MPARKAEATPVTTASDSPNLGIWNAVCATDPNYTKAFNRSGGFKGTAINHTYQQRRATELFGAKGIGWGTHVLDEKYAEGAPIVHPQHGVIGREVVHVVRIELWYEHGDKRGSVQAYGQTTFVGQNRNGVFTDEEAPKKSLTDAESKALASLGFSADVHLGLFDDSKYVNDRTQAVAEASKPKGPTLDEVLAAVEAAASVDALKAAGQQAAALSPDDRAKVKPAYTAKLEALKAGA